MHNFFLLDVALTVDTTVDLSPLSRQLRNVLRLEHGAQIRLLDGSGFAYTTEITILDRNRAEGVVQERHLLTTEPWTHLTLYQCSLKADKFEWVLQKGTELGISQFVPVISERSIVRPAAAIEKKYDRWRKIIQEAAEQCGRGRIPSLGAPLAYGDAISRARGLKILPWEHALAAPEDADWSAQRLETVLSAHQNSNEPVTNLSLLIGPEGGISTAEATAAQAYDWQLTSLGSRILRAETAAIATTAIIMHQLG